MDTCGLVLKWHFSKQIIHSYYKYSQPMGQILDQTLRCAYVEHVAFHARLSEP